MESESFDALSQSAVLDQVYAKEQKSRVAIRLLRRARNTHANSCSQSFLDGSPFSRTVNVSRPRGTKVPRIKKKSSLETGLRDRIRFLESRDTPDYDPAIPANQGLQGKLNYLKSYRNLLRIRDTRSHYQLPKCPMAEFQNQVDRDHLSPEPVGLVQRRGKAQEMNLARYGIGDRYAAALSKGISCLPKLTKINMSCNRLSDKGAKMILSNLNAADAKELDLSYNSLSKETVDALSRLFEVRTLRLQVLHLEGNKLKDRGLAQLLKVLSECDCLEDLNLAKTELADAGAVAVGAFVKDVKALRKLDLHWNVIRSTGGVALFKGLAENVGLRVLDVSWNALGHPKNTSIGLSIATAFFRHPDLHHVDLSHNQLSESDCVAVNRGLSENHSIAGIHMQGNEARVDALGFVNAKEGCSIPAEAHVFVRILEESKTGAWRPTTNCWLCEGWSEVEFSCNSSQESQAPIYLHLSFENFQPYQMEQTVDSLFTEHRMCPPGEVRFFFTENLIQKLDSSQSRIKLAVPITGPFAFGSQAPVMIYTDEVNSLIVPKSLSFLRRTSQLRARPRPVMHHYDPESSQTQWSMSNSVFREYRFDDEELLSRCFEFDWEHTKLPKLIRDAEDYKNLKSFLRKNYKGFKDTYKHFASYSPQGSLFCVPLNAFADLCTQSNLTAAVKIADLDLQFKATNYSDVKTNPRNPQNALIRHQFLEIFVRIAIDKYVKTGEERRLAPSMSRLYTEYLQDFFEKHDSNRWRWSRYLNEDCDKVLKTYLSMLQIVYNTNSRMQVKPGQKAFMCLPEFQFVCTAAGLMNDHFTARDVDFCFNLSMMTQVDELTSDRHCQMSLVEFLEALGRVADTGRYAPSLPESLKEVMERLLALCPRPLRERFKQGREDPMAGLI